MLKMLKFHTLITLKKAWEMKLNVSTTQMRKQSWNIILSRDLKMSIIHYRSHNNHEKHVHIISSSTDFFLLCALCRSMYLFMAVAGGKRTTPVVSIVSCHLRLLGSLPVNLEFIDLARVVGQGAPGISPYPHPYTGFSFHRQTWFWCKSRGSELGSSCLSNLLYHPHAHITFLYSFSFNLH